eukprot:TRINITY_DN10402_c0_g1_i3.p1 TRINITY_DN10402_c0_g1~~TRINITY_DN10402_c0_g1_i3.p1  ORF type:complete len:1265 (+),score=382.87 TRINITY_DN10402_c0_g1_i3:546-3797(+)
MVVAGGHVVLAGADSGEEGVAYRFNIASAQWVAPTVDSRLAVEKPLLVAVTGGRVLMLGGEDATEAPMPAGGLVADAAAGHLHWTDAGFSGDAPSGSSLAGSGSSDGSTVLVLAPQPDLTNTVHRLDVAAGVWTMATTPSNVPPRLDAGAAVVDGVLVVFAGEHAATEQLLGDVWAYDPNASPASAVPSPGPSGRNLTQEAVSAANVKSFDNWDDFLARKSAPWTKVAVNTAFARGRVNTVRIGSRCYFFGGQDGSPGSNRFGTDLMFTFDLNTFEFTLVPQTDPWPPPAKSAYLAADYHRGLIYLYGGSNDLLTEFERTQLWVFDTRTERWRQLYQPEHTVNVNDPCAAGGPKEPFAPLVGSADDGSLVSTRDRLIVAGNDKAADTFARVFDKATERWLEPIPVDQRLRSEDPGFVSFGADECCGIWISGQDDKGALRSHVVLVNTSVPGGWQEDILVPEGGLEIEEGVNVAVEGGVIILGQPSGQGPLAGTSRVAHFILADRSFIFVNQSSQCIPASMCLQREDWWLPVRADTTAAEYHGHLFVFGGVAADALPFGEVWVYDTQRCPQDCNGRGTCSYGNCLDCVHSSGVACEMPDATPGTKLPWDWIGPVIGVVVVVLAGLFWVLDAENRKKRRLYNINRVALQSAEAIARLALDEHLAFLEQIEHPSQLQSAFVNIIRIMVLWRSYIPQSVLHSVAVVGQDSQLEAEEFEDSSASEEQAVGASGACTASDSQTLTRHASTVSVSDSGIKPATPHRNLQALHREAKEAVAVGLQRKRVAVAVVQLIDIATLDPARTSGSLQILAVYGSMMTWLPEVDKKVAVSSCVADEVLVTWGAFSTCFDMSSKVLHLALALREFEPSGRQTPACTPTHREEALARRRTRTRLAAARGTASAGYVGSQGQRFSQVLGTAAQMLGPLLQVGEECGAESIVDARIQEECKGRAVMRPVSAVRLRGTLWPAVQVLSSDGADDGEEWMYSLHKADTNTGPWDHVWSAFYRPDGVSPLEALPALEEEVERNPGDHTLRALAALWRTEGATSVRNWRLLLRKGSAEGAARAAPCDPVFLSRQSSARAATETETV